MRPPAPEKLKLRQAWNEPGHAHFLTYSCFHGYKLLSSDRTCRWVVNALERTRRDFALVLWAYVIMPEHVHVALRPRRADYRMQDILAALKREVSKKAKEYLIAASNRAWLSRLTVRHGPRTVFRFWQPGGGFDRNVCHERSLGEMIKYIHANPVRRGLVAQPADWYWSSARFWDGDRSGPLATDPWDG